MGTEYENKEDRAVSRGHMQDSIQLGGSNFLIRIRFRQNASWQGTIHWLDGKESKNFRSMLEIVTLIQEALDRQEKGSQNLRSWSSKKQSS